MKQFFQKLFRNRLAKWTFVITLLFIVMVWISNIWIKNNTKDQLYNEISKIPFRNVGLVLGTNKEAHGRENLFFLYRINAAAELFKAGKIKHIIVSGDNHVEGYDEPTDMKNSLVALGIPDSCITLDFAGFRTLDSVVRCKEVFGQNSFTIISQAFHNERALFIANKNGMDAVGFNAKDVPAKYSLKTAVREYFAKFKAVLDIYVLFTEPKFLGEKVNVEF